MHGQRVQILVDETFQAGAVAGLGGACDEASQYQGSKNGKSRLHVGSLSKSGRGCQTALASDDCNAIIDLWAAITIRRSDDSVKARLRVRATQHGRSMEDEARHLLTTALAKQPKKPLSLAEAIRSLFEPLGGVELEIPPREPLRPPPTFK